MAETKQQMSLNWWPQVASQAAPTPSGRLNPDDIVKVGAATPTYVSQADRRDQLRQATKKLKQKTSGTAAKASTPTGPSWEYPFNVRYAAAEIPLVGLVTGQRYTGEQIKDALIANNWTEFQDHVAEFHYNEPTNTVVVTIKASRKGA